MPGNWHAARRSELSRLYRKWLGVASVRAASVLAQTHCETAADAARLGRSYFLAQENCGPTTVNEIEHLIGGFAENVASPRAAVVNALASLPFEFSGSEVAVITDEILRSFARQGFVIAHTERCAAAHSHEDNEALT